MSLTLRLPLAVTSSGSLATLPHGSPAEVGQSVQILLATTEGERASLPDYGIVSQVGEFEIDGDDITDAINAWEDRVDDVQVDIDGATATVTLTVSGVATTLGLNILGGDVSLPPSDPHLAQLPDSTYVSSAQWVTDNGDGTLSPVGDWVIDAGDDIYSIGD